MYPNAEYLIESHPASIYIHWIYVQMLQFTFLYLWLACPGTEAKKCQSHQTTIIVGEEYKEMADFMLKQSYIVVMKAEM